MTRKTDEPEQEWVVISSSGLGSHNRSRHELIGRSIKLDDVTGVSYGIIDHVQDIDDGTWRRHLIDADDDSWERTD